jgi:hypothetical protein
MIYKIITVQKEQGVHLVSLMQREIILYKRMFSRCMRRIKRTGSSFWTVYRALSSLCVQTGFPCVVLGAPLAASVFQLLKGLGDGRGITLFQITAAAAK